LTNTIAAERFRVVFCVNAAKKFKRHWACGALKAHAPVLEDGSPSDPKHHWNAGS
jgi:hypothetical protein